MADQEKPTQKEQIRIQVQRIFEQPPDAVSCYCDIAQIFHTGNEISVQFYESIPGPPGPEGKIQMIRTRLKATIHLSIAHARTLGTLLVQKTLVQKEVEK